MVRIRLRRMGSKKAPFYRIVVADKRSPRDGRIIEALGYYLPLMPREQEQLKLNAERISYWLSVGAQPSETVTSMIKRSGIAMPVRKKPVRGKSKAKPKTWVPPKKKVPRKPKPKPVVDAKGKPAPKKKK